MTDHAQRATELAGDCKTTDPRSVQWIMKELEDAYATGRREGLEEAAALADHLGDANNKVCTWTETKDGQYETACGMMYEFFDGGPSDNHLQYCGYCGKRLEEKRWSEPIPLPKEAQS